MGKRDIPKRVWRIFLLLFPISILLLGCSSNPPYKLDSGEQVILTENSASASCSWDYLLSTLDGFLNEVLPYTKQRSSGIDSMVMLHNKLEGVGIKAALVAINIEGNKPFFTCVAVSTTDKGVRFVTLIPQSLSNSLSGKRSEYIQSVYLRESERIGFVEAKFALSGDYSWYLDYLDKFYESTDFGTYLETYHKVIEKNATSLRSIDKTNEEIRKYLEGSWLYTEGRRIAFNRRIERYNSYVEVYDAQVDDYNLELSECEKLADAVSQVIYCVREDYSYPFSLNPIVVPPASMPIILPPPVTITIVPTPSNVDRLISSDDSYNQEPKPDRQSTEKFERLSDQNFIVNDFKQWW